MEKGNFHESFGWLCRHFEKEMSPDGFDIFWNDFKLVDDAVFFKAIDKIIAEGGNFPTPIELMRAIVWIRSRGATWQAGARPKPIKADMAKAAFAAIYKTLEIRTADPKTSVLPVLEVEMLKMDMKYPGLGFDLEAEKLNQWIIKREKTKRA